MTGPLTGVRIIELPALGPVPFLGMLLSDPGADVVRFATPQSTQPSIAGSTMGGDLWAAAAARSGLTFASPTPRRASRASDREARCHVPERPDAPCEQPSSTVVQHARSTSVSGA